MAQPPKTPASSDIEGVDKDAARHRARGKPAEAGQQNDLSQAADQTVGRPDYDPGIAPQENAR